MEIKVIIKYQSTQATNLCQHHSAALQLLREDLKSILASSVKGGARSCFTTFYVIT